MQLRLLSVEEVAKVLLHPIEHGTAAQLMQRSDHAQNARKKQIYGCRHCEQAQLNQEVIPLEAVSAPTNEKNSADEMTPKTAVGGEAESPSQPDSGARGSHLKAGEPTPGKTKPPRLYTFDGLRSHAKEK